MFPTGALYSLCKGSSIYYVSKEVGGCGQKNGNFYWFLVLFMLTEVGASKKDKKTADVIFGWSLTLFVAWENLAQIASVFHYDAQKMMGIRILNIRLSLCSFLIPKWIMLRDQKILKYYANKHTNNSSVLLPNIS